jgi:PEGA domain
MVARTAALVVLVSAVSLHAQAPSWEGPMMPVPRLPEIGLRLPEIGLPLPHIGLAAPTAEQVGRPARRPASGGEHSPASHGSERRGGRIVPPIVYVLPALIYPSSVAPKPDTTLDTTSPIQHVPTGTLVLDTRPAVAIQVFVDSYYIGTTDQIGNTLEMAAGPHEVELKADGYEPVRFGVRLAESQIVTYRETLHGSDADGRNATAETRVAPVTLYVIPGCYAGSVPPDPSALPTRCDIGQLKTIAP